MNECGVFEQIQMYSHQFTATDHKIANFVRQYPEFLSDKGITDFAKAAFVSTAGVSRFCQKVGYSGFNAFKFSLLQEQQIDEPILTPVPKVEGELCDDYITLLRRSVLNLEQQHIDTLIRQLQLAPKISVYGLGSSGLIAQEFASKLKRIGFETTASVDSHAMVIDASLAKPRQVIIAFTHSGQTRELNYAIEQAKRQGSYICIVTNTKESLAAMIADLVFETPIKDDLENGVYMSAQVAQFFFIDSIYKQLLATNKEHYFSVYQQTLAALRNRE